MALREYDNDNDVNNLIHIVEKYNDFNEIVNLLRNQETAVDNAYSSKLSDKDWSILKQNIESPKYNQKLSELLNMESVFE